MKTLLALLLIAAPAFAQRPQTVLIQAGSRQGSGVICGGTANGDYRTILTVAHVVGARGSRVAVSVPGKRNTWGGMVYGSDARSDAALVVVKGLGLDDVQSARMWVGKINTGYALETEGYAAGRFRKELGQPLGLRNRAQLVWSSPSYPGMSGGPSYLRDTQDGATHFLTCTTASDFQTQSMGPYRTFISTKFLPTCDSGSFGFDMGPGGSINMRPRDIEGPLETPAASAIARNNPDMPLAPTPAPQPRPQRPEIEADEATPSAPEIDKDATIAELEGMIQSQLKSLKSRQQSIIRTPVVRESIARDYDSDQIIEIPIIIRIKKTDRINVEIVE